MLPHIVYGIKVYTSQIDNDTLYAMHVFYTSSSRESITKTWLLPFSRNDRKILPFMIPRTYTIVPMYVAMSIKPYPRLLWSFARYTAVLL